MPFPPSNTAAPPALDVHAQEVRNGQRFAFGENWSRFLAILDDRRIFEAEASLLSMLELPSLEGKSFLDVGSGSGLFSLAARRLGARVVSFDYDPQSVGCTAELRRRYFPQDDQWQVLTGSVLDAAFLQGLGRFDVVYSWGVLHHTGAMWQALEQLDGSVHPDGGKLFIALYNDQGRASDLWRTVKKTYVLLPAALRWLVLVPCYLRLWGPTLLRDTLRGRPLATWNSYVSNRGMSAHRDVVDWVGGFPFEVARPDAVFRFFKQKNYQLMALVTCAGGLGCNEFVFAKGSPSGTNTP